MLGDTCGRVPWSDQGSMAPCQGTCTEGAVGRDGFLAVEDAGSGEAGRAMWARPVPCDAGWWSSVLLFGVIEGNLATTVRVTVRTSVRVKVEV